MRAVRSTPPTVTVVDVDVPVDVGELVRIRSAGICASDLKYIAWGSEMILGHELAGTTDDGRVVGIETMFGCDGGMSEYFVAPAHSLVPLPRGLDVADACLIEPASVAWHACRLGGVGPDRRVQQPRSDHDT